MKVIIFLILIYLIIKLCIIICKSVNWKRAQRMYGYFEYQYRQDEGSSRDYGPMQEIDMVGAMKYRESLGATITFQEWGTEEEILDVIDQRQYMKQQQITKSKFHSQVGAWKQ